MLRVRSRLAHHECIRARGKGARGALALCLTTHREHEVDGPKTLILYFCFPRPSLGVPLRPFASTLRYRYRQRLLAPPRSKKGAVQALLSFDDGKAQVSRLSNIRTCSQRWPR